MTKIAADFPRDWCFSLSGGGEPSAAIWDPQGAGDVFLAVSLVAPTRPPFLARQSWSVASASGTLLGSGRKENRFKKATGVARLTTLHLFGREELIPRAWNTGIQGADVLGREECSRPLVPVTPETLAAAMLEALILAGPGFSNSRKASFGGYGLLSTDGPVMANEENVSPGTFNFTKLRELHMGRVGDFRFYF